ACGGPRSAICRRPGWPSSGCPAWPTSTPSWGPASSCRSTSRSRTSPPRSWPWPGPPAPPTGSGCVPGTSPIWPPPGGPIRRYGSSTRWVGGPTETPSSATPPRWPEPASPPSTSGRRSGRWASSRWPTASTFWPSPGTPRSTAGSVAALDLLAGQPDDPLGQVVHLGGGGSGRRGEDDDVTPVHVVQLVGELVHQDPVVLDQRGDHRLRRDVEGLDQEAPDEEGHRQG